MFVPFVYPWFLSRKEKSYEPLKWYQCQDCGKNVPEPSYYIRFSVCQKCLGPYLEREAKYKNEEFSDKIWQVLVKKYRSCSICCGVQRLGIWNKTQPAEVDCFCVKKWRIIEEGFKKLILKNKNLRQITEIDLKFKNKLIALERILSEIHAAITDAEVKFKKQYSIDDYEK